MPTPDHAAVHHAILTGLAERGSAPTCAELADQFALTGSEMAEALRSLAADHGVVLHPDRPEVWVAHPFATAPTPFAVRRGDARWWGTCAWCSLGVAHLVGRDHDDEVTVTTTLGAEGEHAVLRVRDGALVEDDFVHVPAPEDRKAVYQAQADALAQSDNLETALRTGDQAPLFELRALQREIDSAAAAGVTLVAVFPDKPDKSQELIDDLELTFPVLSDHGSTVASQFNLVYEMVPELTEYYTNHDRNIGEMNGTEKWLLPVPATYVIDTEGMIRFDFADLDHRARAEPSEVIAVAASLCGALAGVPEHLVEGNVEHRGDLEGDLQGR